MTDNILNLHTDTFSFLKSAFNIYFNNFKNNVILEIK